MGPPRERRTYDGIGAIGSMADAAYGTGATEGGLTIPSRDHGYEGCRAFAGIAMWYSDDAEVDALSRRAGSAAWTAFPGARMVARVRHVSGLMAALDFYPRSPGGGISPVSGAARLTAAEREHVRDNVLAWGDEFGPDIVALLLVGGARAEGRCGGDRGGRCRRCPADVPRHVVLRCLSRMLCVAFGSDVLRWREEDRDGEGRCHWFSWHHAGYDLLVGASRRHYGATTALKPCFRYVDDLPSLFSPSPRHSGISRSGGGAGGEREAPEPHAIVDAVVRAFEHLYSSPSPGDRTTGDGGGDEPDEETARHSGKERRDPSVSDGMSADPSPSSTYSLLSLSPRSPRRRYVSDDGDEDEDGEDEEEKKKKRRQKEADEAAAAVADDGVCALLAGSRQNLGGQYFALAVPLVQSLAMLRGGGGRGEGGVVLDTDPDEAERVAESAYAALNFGRRQRVRYYDKRLLAMDRRHAARFMAHLAASECGAASDGARLIDRVPNASALLDRVLFGTDQQAARSAPALLALSRERHVGTKDSGPLVPTGEDDDGDDNDNDNDGSGDEISARAVAEILRSPQEVRGRVSPGPASPGTARAAAADRLPSGGGPGVRSCETSFAARRSTAAVYSTPVPPDAGPVFPPSGTRPDGTAPSSFYFSDRPTPTTATDAADVAMASPSAGRKRKATGSKSSKVAVERFPSSPWPHHPRPSARSPRSAAPGPVPHSSRSPKRAKKCAETLAGGAAKKTDASLTATKDSIGSTRRGRRKASRPPSPSPRSPADAGPLPGVERDEAHLRGDAVVPIGTPTPLPSSPSPSSAPSTSFISRSSGGSGADERGTAAPNDRDTEGNDNDVRGGDCSDVLGGNADGNGAPEDYRWPCPWRPTVGPDGRIETPAEECARLSGSVDRNIAAEVESGNAGGTAALLRALDDGRKRAEASLALLPLAASLGRHPVIDVLMSCDGRRDGTSAREGADAPRTAEARRAAYDLALACAAQERRWSVVAALAKGMREGESLTPRVLLAVAFAGDVDGVRRVQDEFGRFDAAVMVGAAMGGRVDVLEKCVPPAEVRGIGEAIVAAASRNHVGTVVLLYDRMCRHDGVHDDATRDRDDPEVRDDGGAVGPVAAAAAVDPNREWRARVLRAASDAAHRHRCADASAALDALVEMLDLRDLLVGRGSELEGALCPRRDDRASHPRPPLSPFAAALRDTGKRLERALVDAWLAHARTET